MKTKGKQEKPEYFCGARVNEERASMNYDGPGDYEVHVVN